MIAVEGDDMELTAVDGVGYKDTYKDGTPATAVSVTHRGTRVSGMSTE
jgi:hypothetical protein